MRITTNVREFAAVGNYVYVVDGHSELHRMAIAEGAGGARVANDVSHGSLRVSGNGTVFFIIDDGYSTLYSTRAVSRTRRAREVNRVVAGNNNVIYSTDAGGGFVNVFRGNSSGRFGRNAIARDVRWVS
jgi:hypothetical protein